MKTFILRRLGNKKKNGRHVASDLKKNKRGTLLSWFMRVVNQIEQLAKQTST